MINFAKEQCDIGGRQYIFSINYDQYTECEESVKAIINNKDNIILDLSDVNDDSKLLKKKLENFDY